MRSSVVLPGAVQSQDDDAGAAVDGQVDVGEDLQRAVGPGQPTGGERGLPAGGRVGEAQLGHLVGDPLALDAGQQPLGPLGHVLRGDGLGGLGPHLVGLGQQRAGLLLGVEPLPLAPALVGLALEQVGLPPDVVDVHLGAVGVEVEHPVDDGVEHLDVVADDDQPALVGLEVVAQPHDGVGVEVVGRLVQQQGLRAGEQDARQLDPAALTTGEGLQRLTQDPLVQGQAGRDRGGLGLGRVAAPGGELGLEVAVAAHRPVTGLVVGAGHRTLDLAQVAQDLVQPAGGEDAVAGEDVQVTGAGVLRQVAHLTGAGHGAGRGRRSAREHLGQRRLAGPVAPDQAHPVAGGDPEGGAVEEEARAGAQLDPGGGDHDVLLRVGTVWRRATKPRLRLRRTGERSLVYAGSGTTPAAHDPDPPEAPR